MSILCSIKKNTYLFRHKNTYLNNKKEVVKNNQSTNFF